MSEATQTQTPPQSPPPQAPAPAQQQMESRPPLQNAGRAFEEGSEMSDKSRHGIGRVILMGK